jgi:hypothetical protein
MYNGLLHLHNLLRWVIIILLVVAVLRHLIGMTSRRAITPGDRKTDLFLMISAHITLLVGLYQWFVGNLGLKLMQNSGMSGVMKDPVARYWAIEHLTGMLIAIVLITIGRGALKKNITDQSKHTRAFWFFLIALVIILVNSPWPGRVGIGRPLIPGMH